MSAAATTLTPPDQGKDAEITRAQAQRDRHRLIAALAEISRLRIRLEQLERDVADRRLPVARVVARAIGLDKRPPMPVATTMPITDVPPASRGRVLVIDHHWPQPDRDSGSVDIFNLMQALAALGFDAVLAASEQHEGPQPARDWLIGQGIACLQPRDAPSVGDYIARHGVMLDLCVLCRVYCGGAFLETVQAHCPIARFVFNSIDLNFLREERRAHMTGDARLLGLIDQIRAREEHVIRSCDATLVVSEAEATLLAETMPSSLVVQMPLARAIHPPVTPFATRRGIGFVGSFGHSPNVDAVRMFVAEIWPLVRRDVPDCTLSIVGADAPSDLVDGRDPSIRMLGHVPDLGPWFEDLRLTVAPLRFGAGAKGKVASSLAAGVPCIATSVAAEGMALGDEGGVLVANAPAAFAEAIVRTYQDPVLWDRLSAGGLAYAGRTLSLSAWQDRLDATLRRLGF
jgi:glycosyltransferase involved in cell wall biosynthesis